MKVLLLEAGKKIPIEQELRSMQWPYDHPRRGEAPPEYHAIRFNEYNIRKPPYAKGLRVQARVLVRRRLGWIGLRQEHPGRRENHPYTGTKYAWVRARLLGQDNIWGRLALRLSDYDFKGKTQTATARDWPIRMPT